MTNETKNGVLSVQMAQYTPEPTTESIDRKGWVTYGHDNSYPNYLIDLYETAPVHGAISTSIIEMIAGKGFQQNSGLELDDILPDIAFDLKIQGGFFLEIVWTIGRDKIARINHLPYENCRVGIIEADGVETINGIWFSHDWDNTRRKKNIPQFIPLFDPTKKAANPRQAYFKFGKLTKSRYYPNPDYYKSLTWIVCEREIGIYHVNNLLNGLFPAFIINFKNGQVDPVQGQTIKNDWEKQLSGSRNAGKFIMTFNESGDTSPDIVPFPITDADKQYEFLARASMERVMIGHRVTSPLLFGIRDSSGLGSNADEMRMAEQRFNGQVIEPYQRFICSAFEEILGTPFTIISNTQIEPTPAPTVQVKQRRDMTAEEETHLCGHLESSGETIDTDEWELISEAQCAEDIKSENEILEGIYKVAQNEGGYANGDKKSAWGDSGLYKLRYAYSDNISDNSRQFCKRMVALSKAGKVFRYEDIIKMGDDGVNGQFAPAGSSTYDIFQWKGGVYCHHFWKRQIYFRKKKDGKFLPNDGLKNDIRVANVPFVPQKGEEGVRPIDTPTRGSLK